MKAKPLCLALAGAVLTTVAIGPAEALVRQSYDPLAVAYSYNYYADAEMTEYLGTVGDRCGGSQYNHWVLHPYIPTAYYDQTPMFVCTGGGPYLPPDW